ncbi:hypothetical protein [Mycolicibacterium grossiae]|uniref:Keratin associated protein n=1 Tax=Mycolicibacterium grossiae TaxID=1552759 RepID=A0A1E8PZU2_9MYCO|nr:hypothetical protein [Mycolicibacterium grossiae]OFJ51783.1 hypothetical protein BEL07_20995 [Mycolicibacterium grossiae]QEM44949.1 hypothetical protein FZ046_09270 [Mycolicibacterium grossiae]
MKIKALGIPFVAAAGMAFALVAAPAAAAVDPCRTAVSSSRCLGPQGVDGFMVPSPNAGAQNGPYGPWGSVPPIGR